MKRYHHKVYSFQPWDTVVRELVERKDQLQDIDTPANCGLSTRDREQQQSRIRLITALLAALRAEWDTER